MGFSEQKHWVGSLFLKLPLDNIELDSMRAVELKMFLGCVVSEELSLWQGAIWGLGISKFGEKLI